MTGPPDQNEEESPTAATRFIPKQDLPKEVTENHGSVAKGGGGTYELLEKISDGGQAVIYKARDRQDGRFVAIKLFKTSDSDPEAERRFRSEMEILLALDHPNIINEIGTVEIEDEWGSLRRGMVMEYLDGVTLKEWVARNPRGTPWQYARLIMEQCIEGLDAAFTKSNVVHRDIKPSNIFILPDGTVKLIDFGVAHVHSEESHTTGGLLGSFDYMAPDFARGDTAFRGDVASDIFGLFVCFYELLTGKLPFPKFGERPDIEYLSRWKGKAPDVSHAHIVFRVVAHLSKFMDRGLTMDRTKRFSSYAEVREQLKSLTNRIITHGSDQYELLDGLGAGAFGEVFKAKRTADNTLVAIKRLFPDRSGEKFIKEARILAKANHPGIVRYLDFFQGGSDPRNSSYFLVMEYLDGMPGCSLRDRIKQNAEGLPLTEVVPMFLCYAGAIGQLHFNGIIHRDIKPANLYAPEGAPERACILDLGVARDLTGTKTTGSVPGSWDYMAPELLSENTRGSPRSDLYALGLCLYESLTGKPALPRLPRDDREAYPELIARANGTSKNTISFTDSFFEVYPELAGLLQRLSARKPADRPRDVREFYLALLDFGVKRLQLKPEQWNQLAPPELPEAPEVVVAAAESDGGTKMLTPPETAAPQRGRGALVMAAILLIAAVAGGVWWKMQQQGKTPDTTTAPLVEQPTTTTPPSIEATPPAEPPPEVVETPVATPPPVVETIATETKPPEPTPEPVVVSASRSEVLELVRQIEILHRLYPVSFGYESFERDVFQRVRSLNGHLMAVTDASIRHDPKVTEELQRFWFKMTEYALSEAGAQQNPEFFAVAREGVYQSWLLDLTSPLPSADSAKKAEGILRAWHERMPASVERKPWPLGAKQTVTWNMSGSAFLDHLYQQPSAADMRARTLPSSVDVALTANDQRGKAFRNLVLAMHLVPDGPTGSKHPSYMSEIETPVEAMRIYRDDASRFGTEMRALFTGTVDPVSTRGDAHLPYAAATVDQAVEFCNWLSTRAGLPTVYRRKADGGWMANLTQPGFRLPTVSEWTHAARVGIDFDAQKGQSSWQSMRNELTGDGLVHFLYKTEPRSSKDSPAYPLGLRDLSGNVHEICMADPSDTQRAGEFAPVFVSKGGAGNSKAAAAVMPDFRPGRVDDPDGMVGFRVILPIPFAGFTLSE
jgi:serine/threonine protein kinase